MSKFFDLNQPLIICPACRRELLMNGDGKGGFHFFHFDDPNCDLEVFDDDIGRNNPKLQTIYRGERRSFEDLIRYLKLRAFE